MSKKPQKKIKELAEAIPCNTELLKWAAKPENKPPQSWWDEICLEFPIGTETVASFSTPPPKKQRMPEFIRKYFFKE